MNTINVPAAQQIRFARNAPRKVAVKAIPKPILVKDQNARIHSRPQWIPKFSSALRLIILVRFFAAMYTAISDCDEVFNYWEPLHFLLNGYGFQTWEYSPVWAIRSYAYLMLHYPSVKFAARIMPWDKRPEFFILRLTFATVSSFIETMLYRSVAVHLNPRLGRYLLFALLFSAGMYTSATNFLPSTFAMWGVMVSTSFAVQPVDSGLKRIIGATFGIAVAAIVGWPFAALLGVPLVIEQLFLRGNERVPAGTTALWAAKRARNFAVALLAGASLLIPVVLIDSHAYQKWTIVPLNIIKYNIFSPPGVGPELYGTSPWSFYFLNGLLSFNILLPLALISLPALAVTSIVDPKRFGDLRVRRADETSPAVSLAVRLSGMYLWLIVLTLQPHKEERFLFPAYGLILFNAATALYLIRGWGEAAFLKVTKSPYRCSQSSMFTTFTQFILITSSLVSISRVFALRYYYRAPFNVYHHFQTFELPRLAVKTYPALYPASIDPFASQGNFSLAIENSGVAIDLAPLQQLHNGQGLKLCLGKEWHRFPSHFLVPSEVSVGFLQSDFKGILPKLWSQTTGGKGLFGLATDIVPSGMNERNLEERDRYVDLKTCDYMIDLDFAHRTRPVSTLEPRYAVDSKHWDRIYCHPFLDNEESARLSRALWLPIPGWTSSNQYGDYCLLRNKALYSK